jgi:hypothetical protein
MIGSDLGKYALWCDLCGITPQGIIFISMGAVEKFMGKHGWVQIKVQNLGFNREICPVCTKQILAAIPPPTVIPEPPPDVDADTDVDTDVDTDTYIDDDDSDTDNIKNGGSHG